MSKYFSRKRAGVKSVSRKGLSERAIALALLAGVVPTTGWAATIQGIKFNDLNGNGIKDVGEPGLPNQTIFISGQTIALVNTESDGSYSYQTNNGGSFSVWAAYPPPGWIKTAPIEQTYVLQLTQNQVATGINFGVRDTTVPLPVANSLPIITQLAVNGNTFSTNGLAQVDEFVAVTLKGDFTDADSTDTHTVEWNFGDGSPVVNTQETTHTYVASMTPYTATFTVKDSQGGISTKTVQIEVKPNVPPVVNLGEDKVVAVGNEVSLIGNFTDPDTADTHTFSWAVNGTAFAETQNTSYTFNQMGDFDVKLTVTDSRGGVATDSVRVTVNPDLRVAGPEPLGGAILVDGTPVSTHPTTTVESDYYYTTSGQKVAFQRLDNYVFVMNKPSSVATLQLFNDSELPADTSNNPFGTGSIYKFSSGQEANQAAVQLSSQTTQGSGEVEYVSPIMTTGNGDAVVVTNQIVVAKRYTISGIVGRFYHQRFISEMESLGLQLVRQVELSKNSYVFEVTTPYNDISKVFEIVNTLRTNAYVKWSEPNFLVTLMPYAYHPNDQFYGNQWHLNNTGQNGGKTDADIDAPEGWEIKKGEGVIIAINDDGVENHPDLSIAPGGWDFTGKDNDPTPSSSSDNHGTSVAGVAAAQNNNMGVVGSAMKASILPVRVTNGQCSDLASSILYGAKYSHVANHSWGIGSCQSEIDTAIKDAVLGNISGSLRGPLGTPMVFASGNSASGWVKFSVAGFPAGTYSLRWKFSKNSGTSSGYDTVWLDDVTLPGGQVINFDNDTVNDVPDNFVSGGSQLWKVVDDQAHARGATGKSVKAGTIGHSQETYLDLLNVTVGAGDLTFWAWVSSEQDYDQFTLHYSTNAGTSWSSPIIQYTSGQYGHQNEVGYPASSPYAIAVGASSDGWSGQEERSDYSQFGPELDVVAPSNSQGQGITTTDRMGSAGYSTADYTSDFGGTSSAAPLTTGVIATLLSNNPNLTALEVENCLKAGTDKIGEYDYPNNGRNDFYGYGRVNLERTLKACMPSLDPCESPTVTLSGGTLSSANLTLDSVVKVTGQVTADISVNIKGLCVTQTGELVGGFGATGEVIVAALASGGGAIRNYGVIRGKNGGNADGSSIFDGEDGGKVDLQTDHFFNGIGGRIYGGRGGDDIAYNYLYGQNGLSKGGNGGIVNIFSYGESINHGQIGPSSMHKASSANPSPGCPNTTPIFYWYEFDNSTSTIAGGNGGIGSSWDGGGSHTSDNAQGGNGGLTTVVGYSITNGSTGRISGGYGGDARVYYCYTPTAGLGGGATITPLGGDIYGLGDIDGGDGNVWIEPRIILSDANLRIRNAENVTIFGGDDTTLSLNNLSSQAIVANNKITLAVGKNGVVDLTGSATDALKAGNQLEILADSVILSDDMEVEDVSDAPSVEVQPGKILYHVVLAGIGNQGMPNTTVPVKVRLVNSGPTTDTYTLTVTDSAGWQLSTLPDVVTVEGLKATELQLNVALPAESGVTDMITVTATSQSDPTVGAKTEITVITEGELQGPYTVYDTVIDEAGKPVTNADIIIHINDKAATIDPTGYWAISGLSGGSYDVTASGNYHSCTPSDIVLNGEPYERLLPQPIVCEAVTTLKLTAKSSVSGILRKGQEVTYTYTIVNGGQEAATGVVFNNQLPKGAELISITVSEGGACDLNAISCTLPDLAPGAIATVTVTLKATQDGTLKNVVTLTSQEYSPITRTDSREVNPDFSVIIKDSPDPVVANGQLHYEVIVDLDASAPHPVAEKPKLTLQLPEGTALDEIRTNDGTCDVSKYPTVNCDLNDLSAGTSAKVDVDVTLVDSGLLVLTHEAKVVASQYPTDTHKERTKIYIGGPVEVDIILIVDTTRSMQEEINGVIGAVNNLIKTIDPSTAPTVALITFKDDVWVNAFTGDLKTLLKAVKNLKVEGGGTCPEASAEALELGIKHAKVGGTIFIATDAPPYANADIDGLMEVAKSNNLKLQAIITDGCSKETDTQ